MQTSSPTSPKPPSPLKILLIGPPGSRKTTFVLQWPKPHVMDCDRNLDGAERILRHGLMENGKLVVQPLCPNLDYTYDSIRSDENGQILNTAECFDRVCDKLKLFRTNEEYKKRSTVIIDSLSQINEFIIRKVLKMKGKTSMEINHWSDFSSAGYELIDSRLNETGKTVICTCHEEKITEPDDKNLMKKRLVEVNPAFNGRIGDNLGAFFTDVWRLEKRAAPGRIENWLQADRSAKCEHLKNSIGLPAELDVTKGFTVIEPFLKGKI